MHYIFVRFVFRREESVALITGIWFTINIYEKKINKSMYIDL